MRPARHDPRLWGLGITAAVHALLWYGLMHGSVHPGAAQPGSAPALAVTLQASPPTPAAPGPAEPSLAEPAQQQPALPVVPLRDDLYYYFPQELDRQLIVLRDHSSDADIALREQVIMHLFVNTEGRVSAISFEEKLPPADIQEMLREVFAQMVFMPGMKDGKAVPSRMKIAIAPTVSPPEGRIELQD